MQFPVFYKIIILLCAIWLFIFASTPMIKKQQTDYSTYVLDTLNSKIHWNCAHYGAMKFIEGSVLIENKQPVKANFTIDMTSIINTDIDNKLLQGTLQNVLKSIEFFNTEVYPESYFDSHSITEIGENEYRITGDFIIFETGICYDFTGNIELKNDSLYFNTKTIILNRTDWGIFYGSANNPWPKDEEEGFVVTDTILLDAHIRAYRIPE